MIIRPETVHDYAGIADIHARAFGNRAAEPAIVALQRQSATFDPELSLLAEDADRVVGHVLFFPHTMRLLGQDVPAVNLAPIAVDPARQGEGIGGRLIEEGHRAAAARGYRLSFLRGHASYYPRFGYRTHAYGSSEVSVPVDGLPHEDLEARALTPDDVSSLLALWREAESEVDFSLLPGPALLDWISPNPAIESIVYRRGGEIVGYARIHASDPARPRVFLARDGEAGRAVAGNIARHAASQPHGLMLPLHPASAAARGFDPPMTRAWQAAMAIPLGPSPLEDYFALRESGRRPLGRPFWPVAFDL